MRFLPYLLKHLRRNWFRTTLTVLAMAMCIFLFFTLQSVLAQINVALDATSAKRLVTRNSVSIVFDVPLAYGSRIQSVPGVERVAINSWFGGSLPAKKESKAEADSSSTTDWSNFFPNLAVELEPFLAMHPEYSAAGRSVPGHARRPARRPDRQKARRQVRLEDRRHLLPGELHPAAPQGRRAFRVRGARHLRHRPREEPGHRHQPHAVQLQVPVRGDRPPAERRDLLRGGQGPGPGRCRRGRDAPEHLEVLVKDPFIALNKIQNAGEILLGDWTTIPTGNYALGVNAILPTGGFAKTFSAVSVWDFLKRSSVAYLSREGYEQLQGHVAILADYEGFPAHAQAIRLRNKILGV